MKTSHCGIALALASALAFSSLAQADTLPTGAQRFNLYTLNDALNPIVRLTGGLVVPLAALLPLLLRGHPSPVAEAVVPA